MGIGLKEFERIDDLQFKGLKIIQDPRKFCFGTDAVLLSHFAGIRKGDVVADLGTGTGIIPILLAGRSEDARITGLEIQPDMADMARRSIELNDLEGRVKIVEGDIKHAPELLGRNRYTLVVSNPPYKKSGSGKVNPSDCIAVARHEILCTLEDVVEAASVLLVPYGRFAMVHQSDRLADIIWAMRKASLEPKRVQMVHPRPLKPPNLVLIEGMKHSRSHLKWLPPLYVYDENGQYTEELIEIYHMKPKDL